jgi:hypothetical protein
MKYLLITLLTVFIATCASAQNNPFKSEAKPAPRHNLSAEIGVTQPDSLFGAWRFSANIAAYNLQPSGGKVVSSDLTGLEWGYEWQAYSYATQVLRVRYSANIAYFPINTSQPISWQNLATVGATFGFHNPIPLGNSEIQIGPDYNPTAPKGLQWGILAAIGVLFN